MTTHIRVDAWVDELQEHQNAEDERIADHEATATNTWGPPGTFGCECQRRNSLSCAELRFGYREQQEQCECLCHNWQDDGDDDLTPNVEVSR